jgi:osmotically-inducible protein OsmY
MRAAYPAGLLALALAACSHETADKPASEATYSPASAFKDTLMVAAIKTRLAGEDLDSAQHVRVIAADGAITLIGAVRSAEQRTKDIALVRSMRGVKSVDTEELGVNASQAREAKRTSDVALAVQVTGAIAAQTGVNALGVHVRAEAGTVTLEGDAPTAAVKTTMIAAARGVFGVRIVVDRISVKS